MEVNHSMKLIMVPFLYQTGSDQNYTLQCKTTLTGFMFIDDAFSLQKLDLGATKLQLSHFY